MVHRLRQVGAPVPVGPSIRRPAQARVALAALVVAAAAAAAAWGVVTTLSGAGASPAAPSAVTAERAYGDLPLRFEANRGQTDRQVDFLARGAGYSLFLTPREAVLSLSRDAEGKAATSDVLRMRLVGAHPSPAASGVDRLPGETNYLRGSDASKWQTGVPGFAQVRYQGVYPGIDLLYYGRQGRLEYDFRVAPGADPTRIALDFTGARSVTLDRGGNLDLRTGAGTIRHEKPVVYQRIAGRRASVAGAFVLRRGNRVGFRLGAYDRSRPLVIDPVVAYSTYLGGVLGDSGASIAVDGSGSAYVVGTTGSPNFPTQGPLRGPPNQGVDAFVTKLNPSGTALVYSTYLGGTNSESNPRVAVDSTGAAYVAGGTGSSDFPTTAGAFDTTCNATVACTPGVVWDGFVTKLAPDGASPVYSTFLGGDGRDEQVRAIALDGSGAAYLVGRTSSTDFPTLNAIQATKGASNDAFVTKVNPSGSALVYSTFLGGGGSDAASALAVDSSGSAYVTGDTGSADWPTTAGAFDTTCGLAGVCAGQEAYAAKLTAAGSALSYSTYLGGSRNDFGQGIAVGRGAADAGRAYVLTRTASGDFPTTPGAYATTHSTDDGGDDGAVTKLNATGTGLEYSTYFGGSRSDQAGSTGIAVDQTGGAHVSGNTLSRDFPQVRPVAVAEFGAGQLPTTAAFVAKFRGDGSGLDWSTVLAGRASSGLGMALDSAGSAYVTGSTQSNDFPTQNPLQARNAGEGRRGGEGDAFVIKLAPDDPQAPYVTGVSQKGDDTAGGREVRITGTGFTGASAVQFGGVAAPSFTVLSATEIVAVAPPHGEAEARVTVTSGGRTSPPNPIARFFYAEGRWSSTDTLPGDPRSGRAIRLPSGKVLFISDTAAALHDPASATWSGATAPTLAGTPTLLRTGRVLIVGSGAAVLYDPVRGTSTPTSQAPTVSGPGTLLADGRVLTVGGDTAELYDPATGGFALTGALKKSRGGHTATLLTDGRVLVVGGGIDNGATAELYDPVTGMFTETGMLAVGRQLGHSATLLPSGKVLIAGGIAAEINGSPLDAAELYDPAAGSFSGARGMTSVRTGHAAVLLPNGKVLLAGGDGYGFGIGPPVDKSELYDPALGGGNGTFKPSGRMNAFLRETTATLLTGEPAVCGANCGRVLVVGDPATTAADLYAPPRPPVSAPPPRDPDPPPPTLETPAEPGGGAVVVPTPGRDGVRPTVSGVSVGDREFSIGSLLPLLAQASRVGTTIRFRLSEPATARLSFARAVAGRRVGSSCRTATRALRARPRCTRYVAVNPTVAVRGARAGVNSVRFQGRLSRTRTLRPGRYRLTVTATDAAGNRSRPQSTTFRLLRSARSRPG